MSVRLNERNEGNLQVLNCARKLLVYTMQACKNENVFPKSQRWLMSKRIVDEALDCCSNIQKANSMRLDNITKEERYKFQLYARTNLDNLQFLVDVSYELFGISYKKISHWESLIDDTSIKLSSWIKSDKERLKN